MRQSELQPSTVQVQQESVLSGDGIADLVSEKRERVGSELIADVLRSGREVRLRVRGSSMLPSFWPNDTIVARPLAPASPSIGQIIVFVRDGRLVAHRIASIIERDATVISLITRGDALTASDPPIGLGDVLGIVVSIVRDGREITIPSPTFVPSLLMTLFAAILRQSDVMRRVALKVHAMRRYRLLSRETGCRA